MNYFTIPPPVNLAGYVRYFWVLEGKASASQPYIHRTMADGCIELIFHYQGTFDELKNSTIERSFTAGISGQSDGYRRFSIHRNFAIFGVYLFPFAIASFFSMDGTAITNQMLDLKTFLGREGEELEEKMMMANDNTMRVSIISAFLEKRLLKGKKPPSGIVETIKQVIHSEGLQKVEILAEQNFISTRQFERNFKKYAGFNPKLFSRIVRFHAALKRYQHKGLSLTEIAYACGYYDQSHFINDFKEFSGYNPSEYFSGKSEATQWIDG